MFSGSPTSNRSDRVSTAFHAFPVISEGPQDWRWYFHRSRFRSGSFIIRFVRLERYRTEVSENSVRHGGVRG